VCSSLFPPLQSTCGDTDLSRPGKQQYECPAGFTYNTGADSVTNPNDRNCCKVSRQNHSVACCGDIKLC
jgi:hypothetical protein